MKKVTNIQIQGIVFNIDEDAYHKLEDYLKDIKKHFEKHDDSTEIITDIESRIAEKFSTEVIKDKHQTITLQDVNALIHSMGTIKELSEGEEELEQQEEISPAKLVTKRLYRNPDDAIIAGVSSGLAAYFGIDPLIIRILFVALLFAGGWSILIYIILWIAMPAAKTHSQKLQMYGSEVTLAALEKSHRESSDTDGTTPASRAMRPVAPLLNNLTAFLKKVGKPIVRILGALFSFKISIAILGISIAALMIGLNLYQGYLDEPSKELASVIRGTPLLLFTAAGYVITFVPLLLMLMAGLSITLWKNIFKMPVVLTAAAFWFVSIALFALTAFQYAPALAAKSEEIEARLETERVRTEISRPVQVAAFRGLHISKGARVVVRSASTSAVVIKGQPEVIDQVRVNAANNILSVERDYDHRSNQRLICFFGCGLGTVEINVAAPDIEEIKVSDNARVSSNDTLLSVRNLTLTLEDIARAELLLHAENLTATLSDNGNARIEGTVNKLTASARDISDLYMDDATVREATASAQDNASIRLHVTDYLEAKSQDMGRVYYLGNPRTNITEDEYGPEKVRNVGM